MTATLAARGPAPVTGVDSSPEMLAAAARRAVPGRVEFAAGDVRTGRPTGRSTSCVSNAVLHWAPGHAPAALPAGPAGCAPAAGSPSRCPATSARRRMRCWPSCAARRAGPSRLADAAPAPGRRPGPGRLPRRPVRRRAVRRRVGDDLPARAHRRRPGAGLGPGTVLRRFSAVAPVDDAEELTAEYAAALRAAYPARADGTTVLPFRRLFAVGHRARLRSPPAHRSAPRPGRLPRRQRERAARLLRRRPGHDGAGEASGPGRPGRGMVPVGRRGDPLRRQGRLQPARKAHPGLLTADLDGVAAACEAAGHPVQWDPDFPGHRRVYVSDPVGTG